MVYVRWYDKDPELKKLVAYIETLDSENQAIIAQDLIQILMQEGIGDVARHIAYLSEERQHTYSRWYDMNLDLSSAMEIMKVLDDEQRFRVVQKITESLYQLMVVEMNG